LNFESCNQSHSEFTLLLSIKANNSEPSVLFKLVQSTCLWTRHNSNQQLRKDNGKLLENISERVVSTLFYLLMS
jgi:hypothetical protein